MRIAISEGTAKKNAEYVRKANMLRRELGEGNTRYLWQRRTGWESCE